jgi:DNA-binding IclR family transcriptional regulator
MAERRSPRIASVSKAFAALSAIAGSPDPLPARELATRLGMKLPTAYHLLNTLSAEGVVVKGGDRGYRLGPRIGVLADAYLEQGEPVAVLEGPLKNLAAGTGETAYLSVWHNGEIEVVATAEGSHAVRVAGLQRGVAGSAHARASGKLLLAHARPGLREQYLRDHPLGARTEHTITDPERLAAEFEGIVARGHAVDIGEFTADVCCVAAPVLVDGRVVAALTVSSPRARFDEERLVRAVTAAARRGGQAMAQDGRD